jgi:hypothetical protein
MKTHQITLHEQIARARKVVQGWSEEKKSMMQLQGTDNFHERMVVRNSDPHRSTNATGTGLLLKRK